MTTVAMVAKGEVIVRDNSTSEACDARDALAKALYGRRFSWIVNRISTLLKPQPLPGHRSVKYTFFLLRIVNLVH